jgi:hypothetical protein
LKFISVVDKDENYCAENWVALLARVNAIYPRRACPHIVPDVTGAI